jgi:hypothetical protein
VRTRGTRLLIFFSLYSRRLFLLTTDLYSKPTDKHQYISPSSCHPKHCFKSIPFSQAIRIKRVCFSVETIKQRLGGIRHHVVVVSRKDILVFDTSCVNFIDGWILLACSKNSSSSLSLCIHFMSTSSINRNHERGCLSDERTNSYEQFKNLRQNV